MLNLFKKKDGFDSLEIARQIIKNTGLDENLGIIKQKKHAHEADPVRLLELVLSLSTTNLMQTLKSDFIVKKIPKENQDAIIRDYITESLRHQDLLKLKREQIDTIKGGVLVRAEELGKFWDESEDPKGSGPGPRYYCVKEVLKGLGGEVNYALHDALFELMYLQYRHYYRYFQSLLGTTEETQIT